ncbi:hypothetical protein Tco_0848284 [Tanacetum coccineum]
MHENKSFNRNPANHRLYHALMEALIEDENAMDKGVANTVKEHKQKHDDDDDDDDPPARPNQGKAPSKGSKIGKSASANEPDEEPIVEVVMDDAGENVPWFNQMVSATKDPLTFDDLIATPIDFSKYVLNRLKIDNLTQDLLLGPAYDLLKGTCTSSIELEYNFQECFNALTNKLDWNNPEGDQRTYTTSIIKTKVARYEIVGIEDMVPTLCSTIKHAYDKDAAKRIKHWGERRKLCVKKLHGYGHLEEVVVKRVDRQLCKFKEGDFVDLHLNDIKDMLLLVVQHKLFYLNESDIVDFIVALRMFTRSLIIKRRVEDLQLGVESYQKMLNITTPQQTFPEIKFKELYTPSYKPPGVIYKDLAKHKRVLRADELYKFSNGTLKKVRDELHH